MWRDAQRTTWLAAAALAVTACGGLAACGGPTFDGTTYRGEGFGFRVPRPPASWRPLDGSRAALAFHDATSDATIAINARCGADADDVPLAALTNHLFLRFSDRAVLEEKVVPFDAREAMHSVVVAKLDGVPQKFSVYVLKKDGCVYDLLYIARPDRFDVGAGVFDSFARGFATVRRDGD
jgi:hypothetical protein